MSKRLQVVMEDRELREFTRAARSEGLSLSEWVRRVLRAACQRRPAGDQRRKLEAIRAAARHGFPTADIDQMNAEIAQGYMSGWQE
jgi:hypothetical protein